MERIFYKPAMKSGDDQLQIYIPKSDANALELQDRDEIKVTIEKTGRSIPKAENRFKKKEPINKDESTNESITI